MVVYAREIDYINRDPNGINENIHVLFRDVLAEPERTLHSMNCVWKYSAKFYRGGKNCCYSLLTYLLGVPISIYWGCIFACTSFVQIWFCTPIVRINSICCNLVLFYNIIMSSVFLAPIWEARAYILKRINVTYSAGPIPGMMAIERVFSGLQSKGQYKPVSVPPLKNYSVNNTPREYVYDTSPRNYNSNRFDNSPREYQPAQQQPQQYRQQYQPQQQPQQQPPQQYRPAAQQVPQQQYKPQQTPQQSYRQPYDQAPPSRQYQPPPQNSYRQPNKAQTTYRQAAPTTRDYVQQQHNPAKPNRNYDYPNSKWQY